MHYTKRIQAQESPSREPGTDSRRRALPTLTSDELGQVAGGAIAVPTARITTTRGGEDVQAP